MKYEQIPFQQLKIGEHFAVGESISGDPPMFHQKTNRRKIRGKGAINTCAAGFFAWIDPKMLVWRLKPQFPG